MRLSRLELASCTLALLAASACGSSTADNGSSGDFSGSSSGSAAHSGSKSSGSSTGSFGSGSSTGDTTSSGGVGVNSGTQSGTSTGSSVSGSSGSSGSGTGDDGGGGTPDASMGDDGSMMMMMTDDSGGTAGSPGAGSPGAGSPGAGTAGTAGTPGAGTPGAGTMGFPGAGTMGFPGAGTMGFPGAGTAGVAGAGTMGIPGVCASPETPIATPEGDRPIASLKAGDVVYSLDHGRMRAVPLTRVSRMAVFNHHVMQVKLSNGVELDISAPHPTADGRTFGQLHAGDALDGVGIVSVQSVPYTSAFTYDILPDSDSGTYVAGGALIGSTLTATRGESACFTMPVSATAR